MPENIQNFPYLELLPDLNLDMLDMVEHPEDFVNEGLYDNSDTESSIGRMVEDSLSLVSETLQEVDLDRDLLLGEDVYETIHYYSRNMNRESMSISPVMIESYSSSSSSNEVCADHSNECGADKSFEFSESSHSDIGYSSNLNTTNNDESLTEIVDVKKKESFCSYQTRKTSKDETIGRSVSDSFLNRVKGFKFLKGKKSKNKTKSLSKSNYFESSASSQSKFDDSGVMNYGSTDCVQLADFDEDSSKDNMFGSITKKNKKGKRQDGFNPCCVG